LIGREFLIQRNLRDGPKEHLARTLQALLHCGELVSCVFRQNLAPCLKFSLDGSKAPVCVQKVVVQFFAGCLIASVAPSLILLDGGFQTSTLVVGASPLLLIKIVMCLPLRHRLNGGK